jgi:hypothetical protein
MSDDGPSPYVAALVDEDLAIAAEGKRRFNECLAAQDIPGVLEAHSMWLGALQSADITHEILYGTHLPRERYP